LEAIRIPARYRALASLQLNGDLGEVAPAWRGWKLWNGLLWSPEGDSFAVPEVRAIPYRRQMLQELQRQLKEPQQFQLL
jgi:hypothetical protein